MRHSADYSASLLGELEQIVLLSLMRLGNGAYGATIRRDIQERTTREVSIGAVYMTLARLEDKGLVCSYIGNPSPQRGGRRRRHYLMDTAGQRALGRAWRNLKAMTQGIEQELEKL